MFKDFSNYVTHKLSFLKEAQLIIAISGGIDSVVLAHLCHNLKLKFVLAHCNFKLRGAQSDADEAFVIALGKQLGVQVFTQNFDTQTYAVTHKRSIQMAARELRYNWFKKLITQLEFDFILTAHHADDNLETFLINFTRGTGLNGLTGIPEINNNIVRPLLQFSRSQIEDYAKENSIIWREDVSNASRKYLRNKLRHEVVPILKSINPQLLDSFKSTLTHLNDTADIIEESLNAVAKRAIVTIDETGITYKISEFKKVNNPKAYLFEMFKEYGFSQWEDLVNLLDAETGKHILSQNYRLIKHREYLILSPYSNTKPVVKSFQIEASDETVSGPFGTLKIGIVKSRSETSKSSLYVDVSKLKFPLTLRLWEKGDYFYPSGMKGKKKLSKYLKDEKLSLIEKEHIWVLTSDNAIVWVVGKRADERFKATEATSKLLKVAIYENSVNVNS